MSNDSRNVSALPYFIMVLSPLFFSTNLIFGRYVTGEIAPFLLATMRWGAVAILLSPLLVINRTAIAGLVRMNWRLLAVLGFLGMGVCGGGIYLALRYTTATNATLIYTTSPVLILLLERLFAGRRSNPREMIGTMIAFVGVATIVLRGSIDNALALNFNAGDLLVLLGALSWAGYSILYRAEPVRQIGNLPLFALVAVFGALANLPVAIWEISAGAPIPAKPEVWAAILGIVLISSLLAFSTYQLGVRALGASVAGVFMYLLPVYGVGLAIFFLGEEFHGFHAAGIALVMAGVITATFPVALLRSWVSRTV
jgi:drug/metabolite transporter (DMT)-like permease